MNGWLSTSKVSSALRIVGAALLGAVVGLAGTAIVLGSLEFAIFGAVGGAVVTMIGVLSQTEHSET